MKTKVFRKNILAASISAGLLAASQSALGLGFFPGFQQQSQTDKYLIVWAGDQVLDDGNYGQPDFLAVINADPDCVSGCADGTRYGEVVNTAVMPAIFGEHLLSETENIVDNAVAAFGIPSVTGGSYAPVQHGDMLDGDNEQTAGYDLGDALGIGKPPVPGVWSSTLNEAHHFNVKPHIDPVSGHKYIYPGGLISSNVFGCDITDPKHIKPVPGTATSVANPLSPLDGSAPPSDNICGLAVSSLELSVTTGTDDVVPLPNGNLLVTQMGYKGSIDEGGKVRGAHTIVLGPGAAGTAGDGNTTDGVCLDADDDGVCDAPASMPPTLQTPGGLLEFTPDGTVIGEYPAAIPAGSTYPAGPLAGQRIAPDRYRARSYLGETTPIDTGPEAHPHGMGYRADLNSASPYWGYYHQGGMTASDASTVPGKGIFVQSDYADPVSLAIAEDGDDGQDLGTTVRFYHLSNLEDGPYAVVQMPDGNRVEEREFHEEPEGLMAMAVTNRPNHKGMFVASMCGGSIYYIPDMTKVGTADPANAGQPHPDGQPRLVYDFGACTGASVFYITRNDRYLVLPKAGITPPGTTDPNGAFYNRDYNQEHDREVVVLDIQRLVNAQDQNNNGVISDDIGCNMAPASKWNNTGVPQAGSGLLTTVGPAAGPAHSREGIDFTSTSGSFWPNNDAADCPIVASRVNLNSPDNDATEGGPHFTVSDNLERYVATSQYFVDLRRFPVAGNWDFFATTPFDPFTPYGSATTKVSDPTKSSNPVDPTRNNLGFNRDFLPGTGSVGDNTVCMMVFNRWTGDLQLDPNFKDASSMDPNVKAGCIDMDRSTWPRFGEASIATGSASPHAMTFITTN